MTATNFKRKTMFGRTLIALTACGALAGTAMAEDQKTEDDIVFKALADELTRAKTLSMYKVDKPYYLHAFANDGDSFVVAASFGALTRKGGAPNRSLLVDLRVGTPELDNKNFSGSGFGRFSGRRGMFGGGAPQEADYDAIRQSLWTQFDSSFKSAAETIAKKRAYLETNNVQDRQPDFGPAPVVDMVLPRQTLQVDRDKWTALTKKVSAVFRQHDYVYSCSASFSAMVSHQYFVSTDPSRHRFAEQWASFTISASTQAEDGMQVSTRWTAECRTATQLPAEEELLKAAEKVAQQLKALAVAPKADDYMGPVLFVGDAAGTFFLKTIGDPLSHPRQILGASRRGRLIDRIGKRIATRALSAKDDPTQKEWNGKPLLGHYPIDDDGVKPQPISLVEAGVLKTYYMSRVPSEHVKKTNGHSRAGQGSVGNLFIEAKDGLSRDELKAKLLELAADEDLEYGILVDDFGGAGGFGRFGGGGGSGQISLPRPRRVYRVYKDGREELVRGATFKRTSYRILKDIVAMGKEQHLLNTTQHGQRVSVVAPAVLVESLELREPRKEFSKPPYLERPALK